MLLHISNRYLDLDSVLGATVKELPGATACIVSDDTADGSYAQSTSTVALFAKSEEALEPFRKLETVSANSTTPACSPGRTTTPTSWGRS